MGIRNETASKINALIKKYEEKLIECEDAIGLSMSYSGPKPDGGRFEERIKAISRTYQEIIQDLKILTS